MLHPKYLLRVGIVGLFVLGVAAVPGHALADAPDAGVPPALSIAEIKITGDEFMVLANNSGVAITDLSSYWLYGFNNVNPLADGVSSSSQQLPAGTLNPGDELLLSESGRPTCGAAMAGKLSISLSDSGGLAQLAHLTLVNGAVAQTVTDSVSWSSTAKGTIQNVPSSSKDPAAVWYRYQTADGYAWQQADLDSQNACQYDVAAAGTLTPQIVATLEAPTSMPPVVIEASAAPDSAQAAPGIPASDAGLQTPMLNELLPNPASPQTDAEDEFIELYNPNAGAFDLSGFKLQAASTTSASAKTYTFPMGTTLPGKSFVAFKSEQTHLGMSNNGGQAWLIDPGGNVIGQTMPYGTAKDGQAWAFVSGSWQWTTKPTPSAVNIISAPASKTSRSAAAKTAVSKKTADKAQAATASANTSASAPFAQAAAAKTNVHGLILVAVAALAVLYGGYEYRHDLSNRFYKLTRHRAIRRLLGRAS